MLPQPRGEPGGGAFMPFGYGTAAHPTRFDLPIALGILIASEQLPARAAEGLMAIGELDPGGELCAVEGTAHSRG